jgi:hypothetical protein
MAGSVAAVKVLIEIRTARVVLLRDTDMLVARFVLRTTLA